MIRYSISFSQALEWDLSQGIDAKVFPLLHQAVKAVAAQAASDWRKSVLRARLWSGEKDAYVQSIQWKMTGDFTAEVTSDYKYAADIETGRPPRDLKKMLDTSMKVRRTKDGRRFLVIPMRHGVPTSKSNPMPGNIAALAKAMTPSSIVGAGRRPSGMITHLHPKTGMLSLPGAQKKNPFLSNPKTKKMATVVSQRYSWGDRLTRKTLKEQGASAAERRKYAGMVRMETSTPGAKRSTYLTFRIMMEGSPGWIIPAQPGQYLLQGVVTDLQPKAFAAFSAAIERTMKA